MIQSWSPFLRSFLATFVVLLVAALGFFALVNPFGNLPFSAAFPHVILDERQRYHYPAIAKSGAYDSAIFGTSSGRLLEPERLSSFLGGSFANLGLNDGHAWEQLQLANVYLRATPNPHAVLFALDWVWCYADADAEGARRSSKFPNWLYDDNIWNDWAYALNIRAFEAAIDRLHYRPENGAPAIASNGYGVFVPPDEQYDARKASSYIWQGQPASIPDPAPDYRPTGAEIAGWRFPALPWLEALLKSLPKETLKVLAFMPPHIAIQPLPGSLEAARVKECKVQVADMARRYGAHYLDFWIKSPITVEDSNFWDARHYRVPVAARIVDDIGLAVTGKRTSSEDFIYQSP